MKVDIYIKSNVDKKEIRVPLLPEEITVKTGDGKFVTYNIMGKGEVAVPTGVGLTSISWESEFPGANWPDRSMVHGTMRTVAYLHKQIESWKKNKTPLNILVTKYPINMDVYISRYTAKPSGPFGSMVYEIEFAECQDIVIETTTAKAKTSSKRKKVTTNRYYTHTVKSGDTLWSISQRYYKTGTQWQKIYDANREIIEQTAKKHGKSSSNKGHWIYPGIRLTVPVSK